MATIDRPLWWYLLIFTCLFAWIIVLSGCDDPVPPEIKYLGPPTVVRMNATGEMPRFDAWLVADGFADYAAFGWHITHKYSTGDTYDRPGIHTRFSVDSDCFLAWGGDGPVLPTFAMAPGDDMDGAPADGITVIADKSGVATVYFGASGWPDNRWLSNGYAVSWHTLGMAASTDATSEVLFRQEAGWEFNMPKGGFGLSWQGMIQEGDPPVGESSMNLLLMGEPNEAPFDPNEVPFEIDPTGPLVKIFVGDIPRVDAECTDSDDKSILIHSRWMKVRAVNDEWRITPAPFITLLPYDSNDVTSIAETAWPYTVCFHAPAESAGMVAVNAKLSIVDPNGCSVSTIDIIVHEVGQCLYCDDGWLWRSDYILPLASGYRGPLLTWADDVLVVWLPPGHTMKLRPPGKAAIFAILAQKWWTADGVVNFTGLSILSGM